METTTLEVKAEAKKMVCYKETAITHSYGINAVNKKYMEELDELIGDELFGNGYVTLMGDKLKICCATYETTDSDEVDEYTANDVGKAINIAIAKLALKYGGYDKITIN